MSRSSRSRAARAALGALLVAVVVGCEGPIAANSPVVRPAPPATPTPVATLPDPQPIALPKDDAPHRRLTEWWYYTGHLTAADGHRYGFEFVVFRAERGPLPVTWASHVALTDETGRAFHYAQRIEIGRQVDRSAASARAGFDLSLGTSYLPGSAARPAWAMAGANGDDRLSAELSPAEAKSAGLESLSFAFVLTPRKPAVLHDGNGWIDFGAAGGSYYYSRPSLALTGDLVVNGRTQTVTGDAWFDHQWGDFIAVGAGGWDWFAVNLADGTEIMLSLVRAADGTYPLVYGTLVSSNGTAKHLAAADFSVAVTRHWTSPRTGAEYPAGWTIAVPGEGLQIALTPTVAGQELDTRTTTGVVYWEGSQVVSASRDGRPVAGQAYVELTGYRTAR